MTQQTSGNEEDKYCKVYTKFKINDKKILKKPWLIHVPAAAVIHEWLALFIFIRRIIYVDIKNYIYINNIVKEVFYIIFFSSYFLGF